MSTSNRTRSALLLVAALLGGCDAGAILVKPAGSDLPPDAARAGDSPDLASSNPLPPDGAAAGLLDLATVDLSTVDLATGDLSMPDLNPGDLTTPPDLLVLPDFQLPSIAVGALIINEVHATNLNGDLDEDQDQDDWVELYNTTSAPIDLTGVGLSNKGGAPFQWVFPAGAAIGAKSYLTVWTSKKDRAVWGRPLHANFTLENGADSVLLTAPGNVLLDRVTPAFTRPNVSWCRLPDGVGAFQHCLTPTLRAANRGTGYPVMVNPPSVSVAGGFFNVDQTVELAGDPGVEIRYSLDGSEPGPNTLLYTAPIKITSRVGAPNRIAPIPTTQNTFYVAKDAEVYKATVLRTAAFANGKLSSPINTHTYFIDPNQMMPGPGVRYPGAQVVSLAVDPPKYFSTQNPSGIYVPGPRPLNGPWDFTANYWLPIEVQSSMELWKPDGALGVRADIGTQISGNYSRNFQLKSLDAIFRDPYGPKSVNLPLFPNRGYTRQKRFRLRSTGNDFGGAEMHDAYFNLLMKGTAIGWGDLAPAVVFINGEYWGYHEIREKTTSDYIESVYGVNSDTVDIIDIEVFPGSDTLIVKSGTRTNYDALVGFVANHSMAVASNYEVVKSLVDVDNLAEYWVAQMYGNDWDWPHNNLRMWRSQADDGKWRWTLFDVDFNFTGDPAKSFYSTIGGNTRMGKLIGGLIKNSEFRTLFINAVADLLNSCFQNAYMNARLTEVTNQLQPLMLEHFNRYNLQGRSVNNWKNTVNGIRTFINAREANFLTQTQGYFGLPNQPRYTLTLDVNDLSMGNIKINTLDLNPWLTPGAQPWKGLYFPGVPVTATALPKPGYKFVGWQGASNSANPTVTLNLAANATLTAVFAVDPMYVPGGGGPKVVPLPPGVIDVALGGVASQSSTQGTGYASAAIDGDFNGVYAAGSVTQTNNEANPWWQVDLGQSTSLYNLQLVNRADCCADRLSELTVFVSDTDMTGRAYAALLNDNMIGKYPVAGVIGASLTIALPANTKGRFVRVQLATTNILSLTEVVVRGTPAPSLVPDPARIRNLALGGAATQSSTAAGAAGLAVDGNPDGVLANRSVTQTATEDTPWWEVDLGARHAISRLELRNRTDCCANRLANFTIYVSDAPMAGRSLAQLDGDVAVWKKTVADPVAFLLKLPVEARGRYVRVQLRAKATQLSLAEVVVLGDPAP